jgi:hypothetical protein
MPIISDIAIKIRAITAPFTNGLDKAAQSVKGVFGAITSIAAPILGVFKAIGGAVMKLIEIPFKLLTGTLGKIGAVFAAVAGGGMAIFLKKQFDIIDASAKTSRALKIQIDFLEGLKFAGGQLGVTNEKIVKSLKKFTRTMGEAKLATGAGATVFRIWGKNIEDFQNMNVEDSFRAISAELKKITDPTKQAAIAFQFFGRNGIEMLNIINENKNALEAFMAESRRLKGAFDPLDAGKVEASNDAVDKLKISLGGIGKEISFILAPLIKFFADNFTNAFVKIREKVEDLRPAIENGIIKVFEKVAPIVLQTAKTIGSIWQQLSQFLGSPNVNKWMTIFTDGLFNLMASTEFVAKNMREVWSLTGDAIKIGLHKAFAEGMKLATKSITDSFMFQFKITHKFLVKMYRLMENGVKRMIIKVQTLSKQINNAEAFNRLNKLDKQLNEILGKGDDGKKGKGIFDSIMDAFEGPKQNQIDELLNKLDALNKKRNEFVEGRKGQADNAVEKMVLQLKELFKGSATEGLGDAIQDEVDSVSAKIKLEPKLALKGSQEAARISAQRGTAEDKIVDNTKETAIAAKQSVKLLKTIAAGTLTERIANAVAADVFDPASAGAAIGQNGVR